MLKRYPFSDYWHDYFKKNKENITDETLKAVGFYIRVMMSFAHQKDSGFAFSKKAQNNAKTYFNRLKTIEDKIDKLEGAYIFCRDAIDVIEKFDCPEAFFYCDPPYPGTNQGSYAGYTQEDFEKLVDCLKNCEGSFMLSCYENHGVPLEWEKFEFKTKNSSSNTSKGGHREERTECVWRKLSDWAVKREKSQLTFNFNCTRIYG